MATHTGTILQAIKTVIDGLTPGNQASSGDVFRCMVGFVEATRAPADRTVELVGYGSKRVKECSEYDTQIIITVYYNATPSSMVNACQDADQIIEALQSWASTNDINVDYIDHDMAIPTSFDGVFTMTRAISAHYRGV